MEIQHTLTLTKDILIIIGLLVGGFLSIKLYRQFAPDIIFRITPIWSTATPDLVVLKIEIENKSKVKVEKKKIKFRINKYNKANLLKEFNEHITFDETKDEICPTTRIFYPGSILRIDRPYECKNDEILHGGIRFEAKFSRFLGLLADIKSKNESWTNTFIIAK